MALKALNPFAPFWYRPTQQESEAPTEFEICGLNGEQYSRIDREWSKDKDGNFVLSAEGERLALQYGLRGWRNFDNDKGPLRFHPGNFALIPHMVRVDLATEIILASLPTVEEKKT